MLRKENPKFEEKLHAISGDISLPGLGLSSENRQFLVKNISIIFHVAATVRFDDPLVRAILLNVRGTRDIALMAREMPKLAVSLNEHGFQENEYGASINDVDQTLAIIGSPSPSYQHPTSSNTYQR